MENKPNHSPDPMELFGSGETGPEEIPVIEDLSFDGQNADIPGEEAPQMLTMEELPGSEEPLEEAAAEEPAAAEAPVEEYPAEEALFPEPEISVQPEPAFPEEEPAFVIGEAPVQKLPEIPSFMERIPDVEDLPAPEAPEASPEPEMIPPVPADQVLPEVPAAAAPGQEDAPPAPETETKKSKKEEKPRATLKGRPKRKKGEGLLGIPNILATFVWLALILAIGVTLGRMLWVCAADVLAFGREDKRVTITVYEADTMEDIIDKLYDAGLIRYKSLFTLYADISDAEEDIKPGIYDLNTRYDYHALVNFMSPSSTREVVEITIPEGYTCRQIFALLEENRVCTAVDIGAYAASGELSDYWFLEGLERGSEYCLEGYLFPDTYQFYKNSSPREALEKMLDNFDHRFTEDMRLQIDTLNADVTDGTYGIREVIIVASLIERESASPAESPTIASVIYNRLFNWDYPPLLNIDAAIVYAQGGDAETIDTSIDSPYNTYRYPGLTPTPIANPGLSSIEAALKPENTNYYYYVLNPSTGMHQFSTTQEEHDGWIDEFYD